MGERVTIRTTHMMKKNDDKPSSGVLTSIVLCILALGVVVIYIACNWAIGFGIWRDYKALSYQSVTGVVTMARVEAQAGGDTPTYLPVVEYRYTVHGRNYDNDKVVPFAYASSDHGWAINLVAQYPVGSTTMVWFDPTNPQDAVLRREPSRMVPMCAGMMIPMHVVVIAMVVFIARRVWNSSRHSSTGGVCVEQFPEKQVTAFEIHPGHEWMKGAVFATLPWSPLIGFSGFFVPTVLIYPLLLPMLGVNFLIAMRVIIRGKREPIFARIDRIGGTLAIPEIPSIDRPALTIDIDAISSILIISHPNNYPRTIDIVIEYGDASRREVEFFMTQRRARTFAAWLADTLDTSIREEVAPNS